MRKKYVNFAICNCKTWNGAKKIKLVSVAQTGSMLVVVGVPSIEAHGEPSRRGVGVLGVVLRADGVLWVLSLPWNCVKKQG